MSMLNVFTDAQEARIECIAKIAADKECQRLMQEHFDTDFYVRDFYVREDPPKLPLTVDDPQTTMERWWRSSLYVTPWEPGMPPVERAMDCRSFCREVAEIEKAAKIEGLRMALLACGPLRALQVERAIADLIKRTMIDKPSVEK